MYINDLLESIKSPCLLYADDVKIWRDISHEDDSDELQSDLDQLFAWTERWDLPVNPSKCKYLHIGKQTRVNAYHLGGNILDVTETEKDLGVLVCSTLKTAAHTDMVCTSSRRLLGAIRRSFSELTPEAFRTIYATHIRSRLEYASVAVFPCTAGEMESIERVQRAATRLVSGFSRMNYDERLRALNLFPQSYRRVRGDLIALRHILQGDWGPELRSLLPLRDDPHRRGHRLTLRKERSHRISAKFRLSHRAVNLWNSLPANVVDEESDETFKKKLDSFLRDMWSREYI